MKNNILGRIFGSAPGGMSPWTDPARLAALIEGREKLESGELRLVDVRTPQEYATGHIPTAVNIPVHELGPRVPDGAKDDLLVVYCLSGGRSQGALEVLRGMGYRNVVNFGAVARWRGQLVRGPSPV